MKTLALIGIILFWILCGYIVKLNAQTITYDSVERAYYAPVASDSAIKIYVRPVNTDSATDLHYQMWYSSDSVHYSLLNIGVATAPGHYTTSYVDQLYLFTWISQRLNFSYK